MSKAQAIEALFQQGLPPLEIASRIGVTRAAVDVAISRYRKRAGLNPSRQLHGNGCIWELPTDQLRRAISQRAALGARKALGAIGR